MNQSNGVPGTQGEADEAIDVECAEKAAYKQFADEVGINIADMEDIQILTDPNVRTSSVFAGGSELCRASGKGSEDGQDVYVDSESQQDKGEILEG